MIILSVGDPCHFDADPDPRIHTSNLTDPASAPNSHPDPTPDTTSFFSDFKDAKK